jgi:hypothetical protein
MRAGCCEIRLFQYGIYLTDVVAQSV